MKGLEAQINEIINTMTLLSKQMGKLVNQIEPSGSKSKETDKKKRFPKRRVSPKNGKPITILDTVSGFIKRSKHGATIAQLKKKTGLEARQVSNALFKLSKQGKIETKARGVYDIKE
jgi:predicted Rossmann fold nucleotide-binding protein DprA/Smf involved in DNA uptake